MVTFERAFPSAICTSSTNFSGTITRRIAVHFCPHFTVISFRTSLIKRSNSGVPGAASSPKTEAFKLSASIVNGTASSIILLCAFSILPVVADPVNVTTSWDSTLSRIVLAEPVISCKAPSGNIFEAIISRTTASVKKEVFVAGLTTAGTPAIQLTAHFSSIPQTGKLNAFI